MSTAAAEMKAAPPPADDEQSRPLPLRSDTFLGVCEAIGQDLGFNANWLRVLFGSLLLWNPAAVIGAYLGLGVVVAVSRWYFPVARSNSTPKLVSEHEPVPDQKDEDLAIAA